jgi:hypothetical protein
MLALLIKLQNQSQQVDCRFLPRVVGLAAKILGAGLFQFRDRFILQFPPNGPQHLETHLRIRETSNGIAVVLHGRHDTRDLSQPAAPPLLRHPIAATRTAHKTPSRANCCSTCSK